MSFLLKIKKIIFEKRFFTTIKKKLYPYFKGFFLIFISKKNHIKLYTSKNKPIYKQDIPLAERIFNSFKKIKDDQIKKNKMYQPSSMWQKHIDNDFDYLIESYKKNDVEQFLYFLQNFGNWHKYLGIESQNIIHKYNKNIFLKNFLKSEIFSSQLDLWKFFNKNKSLDDVEMPMYGNQVGAFIDGKFTVIGSFMNDVYAKILLKNLNENKHYKILELGGGYGKFSYYIIKRLKKFTYIDFDIPETLSLASYFLSKCFPNKRSFFYGEQEFNSSVINNYNLIFLPPWEIEKIEEDSIDISINKNSLGEIDPDSAKNYINHIHRTSKYFFSMNHEYFRNSFEEGKKSLINQEYNKDGMFKELIRYPDFGHLTYEGKKLNFDNDIFFYIFEKQR